MYKKIFYVALLACIGTSTGLAYFLLFPTGNQSTTFTITLPEKISVRAAADSLRTHEVIRSAKLFVMYLQLRGYDKKIRPGICTFSKNQGIRLATRHLLKARPVELQLTIPEGLTIRQTAACIARVCAIDTNKFVWYCLDSAFVRALGIDAPSLEGYLFPDTYRFRKKADEQFILVHLVKKFFEEYNPISQSAPSSESYSRHQIVTMASLVEKEAVVGDERPRIASVFYNRLKKRMPLGADPTIRYIFQKYSGDLRVSELDVESPYNTRKYCGLPPGPICSPGTASLKAALNPLATRELYFVAKWDGSGQHDFSMTNEEHNRKKNDIRQKNKNRTQNGS